MSDVSTSPVDPAIDRTPPQDLAAEQSVLGAMLMSKDAISDAVEVLRGPDFYRPNHEIIFEAIITLYGKGEPADPITVAAELGRQGELDKVGGAVYLHDLLASVSVAANAPYYAEVVREKAMLRRLVTASIRIAQLGYQGTGEVEKIVDEAQQTLYEATESKQTEDYQSLHEILPETIDEIEAIQDSSDSPGRRSDRFPTARRTNQRLPSRPDDHRRGPAGCWKVDVRLGHVPISGN